MGEEKKKGFNILKLLAEAKESARSQQTIPPLIRNTSVQDTQAIRRARPQAPVRQQQYRGNGLGFRGSVARGANGGASQPRGQKVPSRQSTSSSGLHPNPTYRSLNGQQSQGGPFRRTKGSSVDQPRNSHRLFNSAPIRINSREHTNKENSDPLLDKLTKLLKESDSSIVLTLANPSFGFENIINKKLHVPQFKVVLKLLDKVCHSELDKNRATVLTQACSSEFLDQFINLMMQGIQLPSTELSNLLLDMLSFCDEVVKLLPMTACDKLPIPLNGCYSCAQSLVATGSITLEQFILDKFKSLLEHINKIASEFQEKKCNVARESKKEQLQLLPPPDDFRQLSIYPKADDILNCQRPFLRSNIVKGTYNDIEHYLDVQFRLLREDYMRPLREGISNYVRGNSNRKCESLSVRIYTGVKFLKYVKEDTKKPGQRVREGNLISFDLSKLRRVDWDHSKRFMHGSLLCFSKNNFQTLLFATVAEHDVNDVKKGHLLIKFCEVYDENIYDKMSTYLMVESEVYFEPYFQVLNTMKALTEENFPMPQYIIKMQDYDAPPAYLFSTEEEEEEELEPKQCKIRHGNKKYTITVLDPLTWPTAEELGLDSSQHRALQAALTRELVVIQGPPGTGKTFMALKIAEILIKEPLGRKTPILVVCLTNHALDQFLVEILKVTKKLIRIGGQSKSESLKNYNLRNARKYSRQSASLFHKLCDAISEEQNKMKIAENKLETMRGNNGILSLRSLESVINPDILAALRGNSLRWLSGVDMGPDNHYKADYTHIIHIDDLKCLIYETYKSELEDLEHLKNEYNIGEIDIKGFRVQREMALQFLMSAIANLEYHLQNRETPNDKQIEALQQRRNIWKLDVAERWQIYNFWVNQLEKGWQESVHKHENQLFCLRERLEELRFHDDLAVLRDCDVVGMTTNGAARLHKMLKHLKCEVVIVEEAAEVMESHVIACLNKHCKHLILIGDHKQLRPSISVYELGRHYNFDVSLFERMVRNRGQCETLGVQHRMAPAMAKLIVPTIYAELANDKSVLNRPPIVGIPHRLFFISHIQPELQDTEMTSRKNEHEAQFLLALCCHLILQGYKPEQITILATYQGQMFHMKRELHKKEFCSIQRVHITVVDNFQGEENDIILLSLVRSNEEGRIGFLATENRVCVALSRARQGLYIIGNMEILSAASNTWKAVNDSLTEQQAVGPTLTLRCQVHPDQYCEVATAEDFRKYSPEGGCTQICTVKLDCSHTCDKICHSLNKDHSMIRCNKSCLRKCEANLHDCKKRCKDRCGDCYETVVKKLPCGHEHEMPCFQKFEHFSCNILVEKEFKECNHKGSVECCSTKCPQPCENRLPCGHQCTLLCHINDDPDHLKYICVKKCDKLNKGCSKDHQCQKLCHQDCDLCKERVKKKRSCGHDTTMICSEDPETIICNKNCKKILDDCGHWCRRKCNEDCKPCQENVEKVVPSCGHKIKTKCGTNEMELICKQKCERTLSCGHQCKEKCVNECTARCTEKVGTILALCGHDVPLLCWENKEGLSAPSDLNRCSEPCNCVLDCSHKCSGNCSECHQGRFHVPCSYPCNRKLVCGHSCANKCCVPCPPCKEKCMYQCIHHIKCDNPCGAPCKKCKQNCNWNCEHYRCKRKCSQPCSRPPCYEPCKKKLQCQHMCAGLCGEICPPLCWECDREQLVLEAMEQESELNEEPRFLFLPECKHTLEVEGLERWLAWQNKQIVKPSCPRCKTPITKLKRYQENVLNIYNDLASINYRLFKKIPRELSMQLLKTTKQLKSETSIKDSFEYVHKVLNQITVSLQPSGRHGSHHFYNMIQSLQTMAFDIHISLIESMCLVFKTYKISKEGQKILSTMSEFILTRFEKTRKPMGMVDATQISREMLRLKHMAQALYLLENTASNNKATIEDICEDISKLRCYTQERQAITQEKLKEISGKEKITYSQDVDLKIKIPKQPLEGFWFKCYENHVTFKNDVLAAVPNEECEICNSEFICNEKCPTSFKPDLIVKEVDDAIYDIPPTENKNLQSNQTTASNNFTNKMRKRYHKK